MTEFISSDKTTNSESVKEVAKQESEVKLYPQKPSCHHSRESHGLDGGIDENTSLDDVRAPNVFERAKEEFQALSQVFHHKKKPPSHDIRDGNQLAESKLDKHEIPNSPSEKKGSIIARAKEEIKAIIHHDKSKHHHHHHHKETHGKSDDIDENTPANEVKGPNVYERVKEEFEAVLQAIHPKKES